MCIILSNSKCGQTSMLISYTMKEALYTSRQIEKVCFKLLSPRIACLSPGVIFWMCFLLTNFMCEKVKMGKRTPYLSYCSKAMVLSELRHEKTNVMVSDQVRHKPGCTPTEDG